MFKVAKIIFIYLRTGFSVGNAPVIELFIFLEFDTYPFHVLVVTVNKMPISRLAIWLIFQILLVITDSKVDCPSEINVNYMLCIHDMKLKTELPELKQKTTRVGIQLRRFNAKISKEVKLEVQKVRFRD